MKASNPQIVVVLTTVVVATLTAMCIFLYNLSIWILLAAGAASFTAGVMILALEIRRQNKKLESLYKGRKILEIGQRGYETLPKSLRRAMYAILCMLTLIAIISAVERDAIVLLIITVILANLVIFGTTRKYEIYERGIRYGMIFVEWSEIEKIDVEDGTLKLKTSRSIEIRIRDEDGGVRTVIERYWLGE